MFQMIVAIVAVALVVLISIAVIWFGGSVFHTSGDKANFAKYMNYGSQIEGSLKLYQADTGILPAGTSNQIFAMLREKEYLKDIPPGDWFIESAAIYKPLVSMDECKRLNVWAKKDMSLTGEDGCPSCGDEAFKDWPGCKREAAVE